jgi:formamidopyrimidine-DNA glycosylase
MPELPEVETMARDLAPLVEGATISAAWWDWAPTVRYPEPEAFARPSAVCASNMSADVPSGWCWT